MLGIWGGGWFESNKFGRDVGGVGERELIGNVEGSVAPVGRIGLDGGRTEKRGETSEW